MERLIREFSRPRIWFAGYLCWFWLLFFLSSRPSFGPDMQTIPHLDKVIHAVYFTAGSTALGLGLQLLRPKISLRSLFMILFFAALVVGRFDEWHQSHTPGRNGNDYGDLAADGLGGVIGFFVAVRLFGFARGRGLVARVGA